MRRYLLILFATMLVTSCKQDTTTEFVRGISCYSDYSTVTWPDLSEKYYRPNTGDWDSVTNERIIKDFPIEITTKIWHLLQNARTDFHQKSLPLRAKASKNIVVALDNTEAMFDTVFVRCYLLLNSLQVYFQTNLIINNTLVEAQSHPILCLTIIV